MTLPQKDYIQYRIERSAEIFQDALLLADHQRWRSCINRLYYSSFHLVNALLFLDGMSVKSHEGLKTKFLQSYIKTNLVEVKYGKLYSKLIDWRQESDYSVFFEFTEPEVSQLIRDVNELNSVLIQFIDSKRRKAAIE